jgi:TP901 family phage tail tape measure protein
MADVYEAALRLVLKDELTRGLKQMQVTSGNVANRVEGQWKVAFAQMRTGFAASAAQIRKGQNQIFSGMKTAGIGAAMIAPVALAARAFGKYEEGMAEVATLTDLTAAQIEAKFGGIVNATRKTFGQNAQSTIKALYDGISSGVPVTEQAVDRYLKATGNLAVGGKTDMAVAADAITTVVNAWQASGMTFEQASDQMFAAVQAGKTTVVELSQSLGNVASTAAGAGIAFDETMGAIAALTSVGNPTAESMTQVVGVLTALQKPSSQARAVLRELGVEVNAVTIKQKGLQGTLKDIVEGVNNYTDSEAKRAEMLGKVFRRIEASKAAIALTTIANEKFAESTDKVRNSQGLMAKQADKMSKTTLFKYRQTMQNLATAWEDFGRAAAPVMTDMLKQLTPIIKSVGKFAQENKGLITTLVKIWTVAATLVIGLGALKIALGIAGVIKGVTMAFKALTVAMLANPLVLITTLIVGAIVAFVAFREEFSLTGYSWTIIWEQMKYGAMAAVNEILDGIIYLHEAVLGVLKDLGVVDDATSSVRSLKFDTKAQDRRIMDAQTEYYKAADAKEKRVAAGGGGVGDMLINALNVNVSSDPNTTTEKAARDAAREMEKALERIQRKRKREAVSWNQSTSTLYTGNSPKAGPFK